MLLDSAGVHGINPLEGGAPPYYGVIAGRVAAWGNTVSMEKIGRSLKVLVVDDEPLIAMGISDMLEDLGHEAASACSGREALDLLAAAKFDLMITDQTMPDMTGADLAREVMKQTPGLTVFLSTGHSEIEDEAARHLPRLNKPYALPDLAALIAAKFGES